MYSVPVLTRENARLGRPRVGDEKDHLTCEMVRAGASQHGGFTWWWTRELVGGSSVNQISIMGHRQRHPGPGFPSGWSAR